MSRHVGVSMLFNAHPQQQQQQQAHLLKMTELIHDVKKVVL